MAKTEQTSEERTKEIEAAVLWVLEDGQYKAPEEWNWLCKRWYERLAAAYGEKK